MHAEFVLFDCDCVGIYVPAEDRAYCIVACDDDSDAGLALRERSSLVGKGRRPLPPARTHALLALMHRELTAGAIAKNIIRLTASLKHLG